MHSTWKALIALCLGTLFKYQKPEALAVENPGGDLERTTMFDVQCR